MENDIYIKVLKFALERGEEGLSYEEFKEKFGEDKEAIFVSALKNSNFTHMKGKGDETGTFDSYYILSFEGRFKLFEYQELKEAGKSSLRATKFAIAALLISSIATVSSIYYSNEQIKSPARLEPSQLKALDGSSLSSLVGNISTTQQAIHSELKSINATIGELNSHNKANSADAKSRAAD